jgi:hypothetical protein
VAHFAEGFGFDLADALAGDLELAIPRISHAGIFSNWRIFLSMRP